jgi:hypothetical protein
MSYTHWLTSLSSGDSTTGPRSQLWDGSLTPSQQQQPIYNLPNRITTFSPTYSLRDPTGPNSHGYFSFCLSEQFFWDPVRLSAYRGMVARTVPQSSSADATAKADELRVGPQPQLKFVNVSCCRSYKDALVGGGGWGGLINVMNLYWLTKCFD